jgi:leucyl-tRNA synthetase
MRDAGLAANVIGANHFLLSGERWHCKRMEDDLPLELPHVEKYSPGPEGEGPLANIPEWVAAGGIRDEHDAGLCRFIMVFLRYMDPKNNETFCDRKASDYWNQVDIYIGGTEHAVGHLLYSRMWTKVCMTWDILVLMNRLRSW